MKKSVLIATFLVNLRIGFDPESAKNVVRATFEEKHPKSNFNQWNTELDDKWCQDLIRSAGQPSHVNVENFILDLWGTG